MYRMHLGISWRLKRKYFNSPRQKSEWDTSHSNTECFGNSLQQILWQTTGDIQLSWRYMNSSLGSAWRRDVGDGQSAEWKDNVGWVSSYHYWALFCGWQMSVAEAVRIYCEQKKEQISHFVYRLVAIGYSPALLTGCSVWVISPGNKPTCSFFQLVETGKPFAHSWRCVLLRERRWWWSAKGGTLGLEEIRKAITKD